MQLSEILITLLKFTLVVILSAWAIGSLVLASSGDNVGIIAASIWWGLMLVGSIYMVVVTLPRYLDEVGHIPETRVFYDVPVGSRVVFFSLIWLAHPLVIAECITHLIIEG